MKRIIIGGLCALSLAGCADYQWVKQDATDRDYATDLTACEKTARQGDWYGEYFFGTFNYQISYDDCMKAHGWKPNGHV